MLHVAAAAIHGRIFRHESPTVDCPAPASASDRSSYTPAAMPAPQPILYSFRRCPYAMRARMAMAIARQPAELREVLLRAKPQAMLDVDPLGTVPLLVLDAHHILEHSLDIMDWALRHADRDHWLAQRQDPELVAFELKDNTDHLGEASS